MTPAAENTVPRASRPLPMTPAEVAERGWQEVDVVLVSGDAYVDHPSFAAAILGRTLESEGYRVAILSQPDWHSCEAWKTFGRPKLCFAISAGNMDSMINHYTASKKVRNDDAYTPGGKIGRRPDRATLAYCQRARQAYHGVPIIAGGVEASLRRLAHYDYWSDKVRRAIILDAKADLIVYGMGERTLLEIVRRLAAGQSLDELRELRGVAYRLGASEALPPANGSAGETMCHDLAEQQATRKARASTASARPSDADSQLSDDTVAVPGGCRVHACRGHVERGGDEAASQNRSDVHPHPNPLPEGEGTGRDDTVLLPSYEEVCADKQAFAAMTRLIHRETNPHNARRLVQRHGREMVVVNPPAWPLSQAEMDRIFGLPFTRRPHPSYGRQRIPAFEVVKDSIQIMRGCFGGCTFCSLTAHQGRIIQSRSQKSILAEIAQITADPRFHGVISDLGGPTANMYGLNCCRPEVGRKCHRLSCLRPTICKLLGTDHGPLLQLLKAARKQPGVKQILIASGVRMDLARRSPAYISQLARHHTGGLLKVAPEHLDPKVLRHMNKPPIEEFEEFGKRFRRAASEAGKDVYLVPYFMAGHPGSDLKAMIELALFLKRSGYRPDKVQDFIPGPMDIATCMYYTGLDPLSGRPVYVPKGARQRRLQRALLQFFKPENYADVYEALQEANRLDLVGDGPGCLIPARPPKPAARKAGSTGPAGEAPSGYRPHRKTARRGKRA